jgi:hypothetical protein
MRLGGQVEHPRDAMLVQEAGGEFAVGDVPFHKMKAWILIRADEVAAVSRVGEVVEYDQALQSFRPEEVADEGGSDESGAPGEKDGAELAHAGE